MKDVPTDSLPGRGRVLRVAGTALLVAAVFLSVAVAVPQVVGADHSYVVVSDSMSPTMEAGDMIFVRDAPADEIEEGDVITFANGDGSLDRTTHRVVETVERDDGRYFRTKGDANEEADKRLVAEDAVVGRVLFHLPYLGHAVAFASSRLGTVLLMVVPGTLLVVSELWTLVSAARDNGIDAETGGDP